MMILGGWKAFRQKMRQMCSGKYLLAVIWAFCMLYQPPLPVSIIYILTAASFAYMFAFARRKLQRYVVLALPFLFMFLLLLLVSVLNGTPMAEISHFFWLMVGILPAALAFSSMSVRSGEYLMSVLTTAATLQALLALGALVSPSFQSMLHGMMQRYGLYSGKHIATWGYRIYGYGASLMFAIPVVQSVIAAWLMLRGILRRKVLPMVLCALIMFTAMINAKVCLFTFAAALGVGMVLVRKLIAKRLLFITVVGTVVLMALLYAAQMLLSDNSRLSDWLSILQDEDRVARFYVSYYTDLEKYRLPDGLSLIWGTGQPRPDADVDMGFINDVWIGGLVYSAFTMWMVLRWVRLIRENAVGGELWSRVMGYSLLAAYLVANVKGTAFSYSSFIAFFMLVAMFGYGERRLIRRRSGWRRGRQ